MKGILTRRRVLIALALAAALVAVVSVAISQVHSVRWRVTVLALKLRGGVPEIGWPDLVSMLRERGGYGLEGLLGGVEQGDEPRPLRSRLNSLGRAAVGRIAPYGCSGRPDRLEEPADLDLQAAAVR